MSENVEFYKNEICHTAKKLSINHYADICRILIKHDLGGIITESADGCRVDLNKIPSEKIIKEIYDYINMTKNLTV
jgi:hypothetical protein